MPAMSPTDSSDESDAPTDDEDDQQPSSRGTLVQVNPLDVCFSQKKCRHMFWNGKLLADVAPLVQTVRCSAEEESRLAAQWKLVAPFPAIEVVRWRCKLRDEKTGRPKLDQRSGMILYDPEEHLFTLDNRRLYCLQLAATRVWPEACAMEVSQLPEGRPELLREMKKFKTVDSGKSIRVGSKQDKVPFVRWSWRTQLGIADTPSLAVTGVAAKATASSKAKAKAARKPKRDVVANAPTYSNPPCSEANSGALLLSLLKDPIAAEGYGDGAAKGALLLGLLKGPMPQPAKAATQPAAPPDTQWLQNGGGDSWWESAESWQEPYAGRRWVARGRH